MTDLWNSYSVTDVGRKRSVNQDAIFTCNKRKLWIVADGMGGHAEGDKASKAVVNSFKNIELSNNLPDRIAQIEDTIRKVNRELQRYSRDTLNGKAIGTTVVLYTVCQGVGVLLWAGDSRGYKVVKNQFNQVSWDHSHIDELLRAGQITKEEAAESKLSNVITRAVGAHNEIYFDHVLVPANYDHIMLLCSDGLTNELDDTEISNIVQQSKCTQKTIDTLLNKTLTLGAKDNVSIIVIDNEFMETESQDVSQLFSRLNRELSSVSHNFFHGNIDTVDYKNKLASVLNSALIDRNMLTEPNLNRIDLAKPGNELPTKNYPKIRNRDLIKNKFNKFTRVYVYVLLFVSVSYSILNYELILEFYDRIISVLLN